MKKPKPDKEAGARLKKRLQAGARKRASRGVPQLELKLPRRKRRKPTKSAAEKAVEKLMNGFKTVRNFVKNGGRKKKPRAKAKRRNLRNTA